MVLINLDFTSVVNVQPVENKYQNDLNKLDIELNKFLLEKDMQEAQNYLDDKKIEAQKKLEDEIYRKHNSNTKSSSRSAQTNSGSNDSLVNAAVKIEKEIAQGGFTAFLKNRKELAKMQIVKDKEKATFSTSESSEEVVFYRIFNDYENGKSSLDAVVKSAAAALQINKNNNNIRKKVKKSVFTEMISLANKNIFLIFIEYIKGTFSTLKLVSSLESEESGLEPLKVRIKHPIGFYEKKTAYEFSQEVTYIPEEGSLPNHN